MSSPHSTQQAIMIDSIKKLYHRIRKRSAPAPPEPDAPLTLDTVDSTSTSSKTDSVVIRRGAPSSFNILELPTDLLLCIADFLPLEDNVAMALTCRALFATMPVPRRGRRMWMQLPEKQDLLRRLERDLGFMYSYCTDCIKLYRYDTNPGMQAARERHRCRTGRCTASSFGLLETWTNGECYLGYQTVRLLANNRRWGKGIGISPAAVSSMLRRPIPFTTDTEDPHWHVNGQIRFVKNNMMILRATHLISGTDADMMRLLKCHDILKHRMCYHYTALQQIQNLPNAYYWNDYSSTQLKHPPPPPCSNGGCSWCLTDWSYEVERRRGIVTLRIVTYHLIGDGMCNLDNKWRMMTARDLLVNPESKKAICQEYYKGTLSKLWAEAK